MCNAWDAHAAPRRVKTSPNRADIVEMRTLIGAAVVVGLVACGGGPGAGHSELAVVRSVRGAVVCVDALESNGFCSRALDTRSLDGVEPGDCVDMTRDLRTPPAKIEVVAQERCQ